MKSHDRYFHERSAVNLELRRLHEPAKIQKIFRWTDDSGRFDDAENLHQ
jgi:hypothetical protein